MIWMIIVGIIMTQLCYLLGMQFNRIYLIIIVQQVFFI